MDLISLIPLIASLALMMEVSSLLASRCAGLDLFSGTSKALSVAAHLGSAPNDKCHADL